MLRDGGTKLEALHQADQPAERTVIPISEAPKRAWSAKFRPSRNVRRARCWKSAAC